MLHNINLLPWREKQQQLAQRRFTALLIFGLVAALLSQWSLGRYLDEQQARQSERNLYLNQLELKRDKQLKQLAAAKQKHQTLLEQVDQVTRLQTERNKVVAVMNLLPQLIPSGVYVDKLALKGFDIELSGISESTQRLTYLLTQLEQAPQVSEVEMHAIMHGVERFAAQYQSYRLSFTLRAFAVQERDEK